MRLLGEVISSPFLSNARIPGTYVLKDVCLPPPTVPRRSLLHEIVINLNDVAFPERPPSVRQMPTHFSFHGNYNAVFFIVTSLCDLLKCFGEITDFASR